ncbi:MFS transporter [Patulibacter minatonensis]|uniref:MFS transporter n=1 Tax=Patulibacter minatonensis TaxID=298163 RepID=UPI0004B5FAB7|nr:MFS transporter [Patulibacter minatonensis]
MSPTIHRTFDSLHVPNYRRYFAGQVVSVSGNWIQNVAAMWLMVKLTGDGLAVGLTAALQFLPLMLFGAWGGLLADRVDKRRLLIGTQLGLMVPAVVLAATTFTGTVTPLVIYAMVFLRGTAMAIDNPARQALPIELVGPDRVVNAVALNSVVIQTSRIIGPGVAGLLIAVVGIAWCFVVDALSFLAMIVALLRLDPEQMGESPRAARRKGALREGVRYVRGAPHLVIPLAMMAVIGLLSFNFQIVLPLMAHDTWRGTATTFTLLTMTMAVGSVIGALVAGNRREITPRLLVGAATLFGTFQLLAAVAPVLPLQLLPLVFLGMASVTFSSGVNSTLQLQVEPAMRGRVMALYSLVFLGSTPIGAPLVGWIAGWAGPRAGMAVGGVAALVAAAGAWWAYRRVADRVADAPAGAGDPGVGGAAAPSPAPRVVTNA